MSPGRWLLVPVAGLVIAAAAFGGRPSFVFAQQDESAGQAAAAEEAGERSSPQAPQSPQAAQAAALRDRAWKQVVASSRSDDPFLRANAIEAAEHLPERLVPMAQLGIDDESAVVRFAAAMMVLREGLSDLSESLKPLLRDESAHVRAAVGAALSKLGEDVNLTPLAGYLQSGSPGLRANVAMALSHLGDRSAAPMLEDPKTLQLPPTTSSVDAAVMRVQLAEARVRLGDDEALDPVRAALFSTFDEVRVLAAQTLGRLGDERMQEALFDILTATPNPIDLRLAAIESLARTGPPPVIKDVLELRSHLQEGAEAERPAIRAQAAHTLGAVEIARRRVRRMISPEDPRAIRAMFDDARAWRTLVSMLEDRSEQVRLTAADAVLEVGQWVGGKVDNEGRAR